MKILTNQFIFILLFSVNFDSCSRNCTRKWFLAINNEWIPGCDWRWFTLGLGSDSNWPHSCVHESKFRLEHFHIKLHSSSSKYIWRTCMQLASGRWHWSTLGVRLNAQIILPRLIYWFRSGYLWVATPITKMVVLVSSLCNRRTPSKPQKSSIIFKRNRFHRFIHQG